MPAPGDNAVSAADASRLLDAFEEALEDLRLSYEKYFIGIERHAPAQRHRDLKAQMRRLEELRPRATAVRFRLAGLRARLVTYEYYWTRVLGQIEKGTHRRDLQQRSQRRAQADTAAQPHAAASPRQSAAESAAEFVPTPPAREADVPRPRMVTEISAPRPTPPTPGPPRPSPPPVPVPGMRGVEVRRLFQDLVQAKQAAGEDVQGLTERALARKLARELPKLHEQHGGPVKFEVATVAGKVSLRARRVADEVE